MLTFLENWSVGEEAGCVCVLFAPLALVSPSFPACLLRSRSLSAAALAAGEGVWGLRSSLVLLARSAVALDSFILNF